MSRRLWRLVALQTLAFALLAEAALRVTGIDKRLLAPVLDYQMVDLEVHQPSPDARLLYEMKPNASHHYDSAPPRTVTINGLGFRGRDYSAAKPRGVFRIVCIGSSNTYGALVSDEETYPAQMERLLNAAHPGRFEVWNEGMSADSFFQDAVRAQTIVDRYAPDLLLFQVHNVAPRMHFLVGQDYMPYFEREPGLYLQFLVPAPLLPRALQIALLAHVRLFRTCLILYNYVVRDPAYTPATDAYAGYRDFYARLGGKIPVTLLVNIPLASPLPDLRSEKLIKLYELLPKPHGPEYLEIHPPAHVYSWYARTIVDELSSAGLLPK